MDVSAVGQVQDLITSEVKAEQAKELYNVKLIKMAQESEALLGTLIEDTVEISEEAMQRFMAEKSA